MSEESLEHFVTALDDLDGSRARIAIAAFGWLTKSDPELATLAMAVFQTSDKAAAWFAGEIHALGNETPLTLLHEGKRELVVDCLYRIEHGMFA